MLDALNHEAAGGHPLDSYAWERPWRIRATIAGHLLLADRMSATLEEMAGNLLHDGRPIPGPAPLFFHED